MSVRQMLRETSRFPVLPVSSPELKGYHVAYLPKSADTAIPHDALGPMPTELLVPAPAGTSIRIARGASRQMLFIDSGDRLDADKHRGERVCGIIINHHADGKVTVLTRDTPFYCSVTHDRPGYSYGITTTDYHSIEGGKTTRLLASHRNDGAWTIQLGNRPYKLEITPGETLVVTHKPR